MLTFSEVMLINIHAQLGVVIILLGGLLGVTLTVAFRPK